MADSMCGPSNGAKNLLSHVDRDRSMHQDRFTGNAQAGGSASFRSNTPFGQGAEMGFNNFQQTNMAPEMAVNHMLPIADRTFTPPVHHPAHAPPIGGPPAAFAQPPVTMARPADQGWVNEFSAMNIGANASQPRMANTPHAGPLQAQWPAPAFSFPSQPEFMLNPFQHQTIGNSAPFSFSQQESTAAQPQMDVEAFNRAFGDYDGMLFEQQVAAWKEKEQIKEQLLDQQLQEHSSKLSEFEAVVAQLGEMVAARGADKEFEEAQADWMAKHGPTAEAERTTRENESKPEPQALKKRVEDEQLAKAAIDIVNSVSDNATEKFQKSQFLELMRRIANKEVVVDGTNFVDAETGEGLDTTQKENANNDGDHQLRPSNSTAGAASMTSDA